MTRSAHADSRDDVRETCAACGQHCAIRWFHRFPTLREPYVEQRDWRPLTRPWLPTLPAE